MYKINPGTFREYNTSFHVFSKVLKKISNSQEFSRNSSTDNLEVLRYHAVTSAMPAVMVVVVVVMPII